MIWYHFTCVKVHSSSIFFLCHHQSPANKWPLSCCSALRCYLSALFVQMVLRLVLFACEHAQSSGSSGSNGSNGSPPSLHPSRRAALLNLANPPECQAQGPARPFARILAGAPHTPHSPLDSYVRGRAGPERTPREPDAEGVWRRARRANLGHFSLPYQCPLNLHFRSYSPTSLPQAALYHISWFLSRWVPLEPRERSFHADPHALHPAVICYHLSYMVCYPLGYLSIFTSANVFSMCTL